MNASFCLKCTKKVKCISICPKLEAHLPKDWTGRNRKETSVGNCDDVEYVANTRAFKLKYNKDIQEEKD